MEKRVKNRFALLGSLLVIGLVLAGIGSALGAGTVLAKLTQGFGNDLT